ncbi:MULTISPECIES: ABC transporter ATP-binding protein [unclassified Sphaerochaeta]|jgi:simple sugar transport system ATP-binding protein|uniref:ABC transporter ATP-binding protein n=1 Tax=unclassified Sphaerochaeta TaxID=2637943 RepID=UPI0025FDD94D|nr:MULTISPECIES: ABC transporter ATP-binding protein [unclassified Sphaerochaeta]MDX9824444.1 ABC transporter ATP-binding protein [Sphaerochaeta sp.]HPE94035.1 ABC transporter ATP-binding protein [Sphaerochaeta sp.]
MELTTKKITSLRMEHITKRFPGVLASDDITLSIGEGEVLALVGENGAGKTTLMNILMGLYQPDEGRILINGEEVHFRSPNDAFAAGLGMVHQQYMLVPNMTVLENIALGYKQAWSFFKLDLAMVRDRIDEISKKYGLFVDPDAYIWQLSVGEQQRVELVKTLCLGARFLILDEPTSALTPQETDDLIVLLKRMSSELSIIFISHKLQEVKDLSDKITILRHGAVVFEGNTNEHSPSDIAALMTGHEVELPLNEEASCNGTPVLDIKNLNVKSDRGFLALRDLNLTIRCGEIVGLAGVSGNGQRELAEAINGLRKVESGEIIFYGENIANKSPHYIIQAGMGYIPEERNTEGIVPSFSLKENLILKDAEREEFSKHSFLNNKAIDKNANDLRVKFDIRSPNIAVAAGSLSGGNIQKVILARELSRKPKFLIAVYPIRGLDLGAAEFIHKQLLEKRREGIGILLISEELDEILDLSDRVAVIFKGQIQKVLDRKDANRRSLGILMAGVKDDQTV